MQNTYCKQFAIIFFYNLRYCIFDYFNIFYKDFPSFASNDCQKYVRIFYKNTSIIYGCYFIKIYIDGQNEIVLPILHSILLLKKYDFQKFKNGLFAHKNQSICYKPQSTKTQVNIPFEHFAPKNHSTCYGHTGRYNTV